MKNVAIIAALLFLGGCTLKTGSLSQSEIDKLVADVQGTGATVQDVGTGTWGSESAKINTNTTNINDELTGHTGNTSNPHGVTATQVGLGSVDNTADADKPISTLTQAALGLKQNALSNASTIAKITESGGDPLWDGSAWPGGEGGTDDQTAAEVNVADAGGYYNGATVEAILQEIFPQLGSFDEDGTYTITGTFDYGDGTVVLPLLTLDPYDSGWSGSQKMASQGDVYTKMETKANAADLASQAAFESAFFALPSDGSFSFDTFPAYEDSAHSTGLAKNATHLAFWNGTKWLTIAGVDTLDPSPSFPTLSSATIPTAGNSVTLAFSEAVDIGTGGSAGWDMDCSAAGSDIAMTYSSGDGTASYVYTLGTTVNTGDSCDVDYTQPGDGLEDSGGDDLQSITSAVVMNDSTQGASSIINQNFEGSGVDNGETSMWSFTQCDPDHTNTVLRGSQSLEVSLDNAPPSCLATLSSTESEVWVHFRFASNYGPGGVHVQIMTARNSADTEDVFTLSFDGTNVRFKNGTTLNDGSYAIASDLTMYHVWLHLDAANKAGEVYIGTSTTRPGSPIASVSSGNATSTAIGKFKFAGPSWKSASTKFVIDQFMVEGSSFTTVEN